MSNSNISRTGGKLFSETTNFVTTRVQSPQVSSGVSKILGQDSFNGLTLQSKGKKNVLAQMYDIARNFVKDCLFEKKDIRPRIEYQYPIIRQISETKKVIASLELDIQSARKSINREQERIMTQRGHHSLAERKLAEHMLKVNLELGGESNVPGFKASPEEVQLFLDRTNKLIALNEKQRALREEKAAFEEDVSSFGDYVSQNYTPKMKEWIEKRKELARLEADLRDIEDQLEEQILLSSKHNSER